MHRRREFLTNFLSTFHLNFVKTYRFNFKNILENITSFRVRCFDSTYCSDLQLMCDLFQMSRCVVRTHYELMLKNPDRGIWQTIQLRLSLFWALFKIQSYEWYLITRDTFPFRCMLL